MRARAAFTLVETLLALALLLVITSICVGFFYEAKRIHRDVLDEVETVSAARMVMNRMAGELRCASPVVSFTGDVDWVRFGVSALPSSAVWQPATILDGGQPAGERDVRWVAYRLRFAELDDGITAAVGLERLLDPVVTARFTEEGEPTSAQLVTDRVRFLALRYWDGNQWLSSWSASTPPPAVEVRIGAPALPEGIEPDGYPFQIYRRVIDLPTGRPPAAGSTLDGGFFEP